jgi:hypothetical protein
MQNPGIGDRRFIGTNGYSCSEPGVANGDQDVVDRFHSHSLEGTAAWDDAGRWPRSLKAELRHPIAAAGSGRQVEIFVNRNVLSCCT